MKKRCFSKFAVSLIVSLSMAIGLGTGMLPGGRIELLVAQAEETGTGENDTTGTEVESSTVRKGTTLNCFGWSYSAVQDNWQSIIEKGFDSVQVAPLQPTAVTAETTFENWDKLYEATAYAAAESSVFGTADDFKALCEKVHAGTPDDYSREGQWNVILEVVVSDSIATTTTPEEELTAYLEQCIDLGADGFCFVNAENASSITTVDWQNIITAAKTHAAETRHLELYCYAEVSEEKATEFAAVMDVTSDYARNIRNSVVAAKAASAYTAYDGTAIPAEKVVFPVETREEAVAGTASAEVINQAWALTAPMQDAMSIYIARPDNTSVTLGTASSGNDGYASKVVEAVNKFNNYSKKATRQQISCKGSVTLLERAAGAVFVSLADTASVSVNIPVTMVEGGTYNDQITGNTFTVSGGAISGAIGSTKVAVVYNSAIKFCEHPEHNQEGVCTACNETVAHAYDTATFTCSCGAVQPVSERLNAVYFYNTDNWDSVWVHTWNSTTGTVWPGINITGQQLDNGYYYAYLDAKYDNIIFNNGAGTQTGDLSLEECGVYYEDGFIEDFYHNYTDEVTNEAACKSAATCTENAVYYYSCEYCGAVSTETTFTVEGTATGHTINPETNVCSGCNRNFSGNPMLNDNGTPDDSGDDYYEIANAEQLLWFAEYVNSGNYQANAKLLLDIDLSTVCGSGIGNWTPIGSESPMYNGVFDGQGHTVSSLYFSDTAADYVGLFGSSRGTIQNVGVVNSSVTGNAYVGGICGWNNGKIIQSYNTGTVTGSTYVGGICGHNDSISSASYGRLTNCYNTGAVTGDTYVGGICGVNYAFEEGNYKPDISHCYNTGAVTGTSNYGGICGSNASTEITGLEGTINNTYYLDTSETDAINNTTFLTADEFTAGKAAYLLRKNQTDQTLLLWGQDIGTESAPVLGGKEVYYGGKTCVDAYTYGNETLYYSPNGEHTYLYDCSEKCSICFDIRTTEHIYTDGSCTCGRKFLESVENKPIYFDNSVSNWNDVYVYAWDDSDSGAGTIESVGNWPGSRMQEMKGSIYTYTLPVQGSLHMIFNNGSGNQTVDIKNLMTCTVYCCKTETDGEGKNLVENSTEAYHTFTIKNICEEAFVSDATCTNNKTYHYSCEYCGAVSTEDVFELADTNLGGHVDTDNNNSCDTCTAVIKHVINKNNSLTLEDNVAVNLYMELSEDVKNDASAYFKITLPDGSSEEISVSEAVQDTPVGGTEAYYKLSGDVAAKEMAQKIKVEVYREGEVVQTYEYSALDYATQVINNASSLNSELVSLTKAMLNYGAMSQLYFGYETDTLANSILDEQDKTIADVDTTNITAITSTENTLSGIKHHSYSCVLESKTILRHYFSLENGSGIDTYTFTVGDKTLTAVKTETEGLYYVDITGIAAKELDTPYTLTISDGAKTRTITASVMSYVRTVLESGTASEQLKNVVQAMYHYNQAANAYFTE